MAAPASSSSGVGAAAARPAADPSPPVRAAAARRPDGLSGHHDPDASASAVSKAAPAPPRSGVVPNPGRPGATAGSPNP
jgi:hypothetical protein